MRAARSYPLPAESCRHLTPPLAFLPFDLDQSEDRLANRSKLHDPCNCLGGNCQRLQLHLSSP